MEPSENYRRLAAILAADVVGYSRLMAADEAGTLAALTRHRADVFDPTVARHNGRIVKLMGDGVLVEFASVVDAVRCGIAVQNEMAEPKTANPQIVLRIGINLGDIIIQGDDIYGDGVNIAARIEALAQPGGICVSSIVNESSEGRVEVAFQDGGSVTVKNIDRPLRVWHWHPENAPAPQTFGQRKEIDADSAKPSIAVLPFDNMSGDAEQEYFSDGISEDIITDLSKVSGLIVIARNSSFAYKGTSVDLRKVGTELGVRSVLEGSVRRSGNRVRVTAQLIDAVTGAHLWADRYDRDLTDIFAVQDEVTLEIVNALKIRLSPAEIKDIAAVGTTNIEAHEAFMQCRSYLFYPGMDAEIWQLAIKHGERAITLDPNYAQAYAMLTFIHLLDFHNHWSGEEDAAILDRAEGLARRALGIDPEDITSLQSLAVVARWQGNHDLSLSLIEKVLTKNADNSLSLFNRGELRMSIGELSQSISDIERAIRLDPSFRHQYLQFLGMSHLLSGHYETAAAIFRERVLLTKTTDVGRAWLACALGHLGETAQAQEAWAEMLEINPAFSMKTRLAKLLFADPSYTDKVIEGLTKAGIAV
jgi:adenylate cyclase